MLVDFPKTLVEFGERFGTEAACREYLMRLRWPDGFRCPKCGHDRGWTNGGMMLFFRLAQQGVQTPPVSYRALTKPRRRRNR
jgi:tRNA(Ile2) C34 agmatinyltransferase TiaS